IQEVCPARADNVRGYSSRSGPSVTRDHCLVNEMRDVVGAVESRIAGGPILPNVTVQEIRSHLNARYDFRSPMALEDVAADVEEMLSKWQVQVTHPRYLGL